MQRPGSNLEFAGTLLGVVGVENVLYYGDNLDILRRYVKDESVDLIYLDPPFKSNQNCSVLFKEKDGTQAASRETDKDAAG